jgi:hypothetical protein
MIRMLGVDADCGPTNGSLQLQRSQASVGMSQSWRAYRTRSRESSRQSGKTEGQHPLN